MQPFFKWVGGKTWLADQVMALYPQDRWDQRTYYEPFLGGGAVALRMLDRGVGRAVLTDANDQLVAAWQAVQRSNARLVNALLVAEERHCEEYYYAERAREPAHTSDAASRFLYLMKAGFNGLWRVNKSDQMNTPWGKRGAIVFDVEHLARVGAILVTAHISAADWRDALADVKAGDLVYLDPPYGAGVGYTSGSWTHADDAALAARADELRGEGARVIISGPDTAEIKQLYANWTTRVVARRCRVKGGSVPRSELLVY